MFEDLTEESEFARRRGVSLRTVQRERAKRNGPPFIRVGKKIYYREDAIRKWLLAQEVEQPRAIASRGTHLRFEK